jgi:hypothetical protein
MFRLNPEHLFAYSATLQAPPEAIGPVPEGARANFYVTGGEVVGPRVRGKLPPRLPLRTTPVFRTAHPQYQWLHRLLCVGIGEADLEKFTVSYDVYAIRWEHP